MPAMARALLALALLLCADARAAEVVRRSLGRGAVVLERDSEGRGRIVLVGRGGARRRVSCDPLPGAWGLWVDDVDGDDRPDLLVALHKRARFDPVLENRLHVFALRGARCVPLWRGSRLAGRFDRLGRVHGGRLLALERTGRGWRRLARYRWAGFGFALQRVIWRGQGRLPLRLARQLDAAGGPTKRRSR